MQAGLQGRYHVVSIAFIYCHIYKLHPPNDPRFFFKVSGLPNPELMWLVNGRPINPDLYHKMLVRENGVHSLVIDPLTQKDAGTYTCIASNKAGQGSFSLELKVVGEQISVGVGGIENKSGDFYEVWEGFKHSFSLQRKR